jgi:hypothetical protein
MDYTQLSVGDRFRGQTIGLIFHYNNNYIIYRSVEKPLTLEWDYEEQDTQLRTNFLKFRAYFVATIASLNRSVHGEKYIGRLAAALTLQATPPLSLTTSLKLCLSVVSTGRWKLTAQKRTKVPIAIRTVERPEKADHLPFPPRLLPFRRQMDGLPQSLGIGIAGRGRAGEAPKKMGMSLSWGIPQSRCHDKARQC